jgi:hypothetical protein
MDRALLFKVSPKSTRGFFRKGPGDSRGEMGAGGIQVEEGAVSRWISPPVWIRF